MNVAIRLNGTVYYGGKYEQHTDCLQRVVKELAAEQDARAKLLADIDAGTLPIEFGWAEKMIPVGFDPDGDGMESWRKRDYVSAAKSRLRMETGEIEGLGLSGYSADKFACNCPLCRDERVRREEKEQSALVNRNC